MTVLPDGWTITMLVCLFSAVQHGLLVQPDMQVSGNGSWPPFNAGN